MMLRLADGAYRREPPAGSWRPWSEAATAAPGGLTSDAWDKPWSNPPFKNYTHEFEYFAAHVNRLLFPTDHVAKGSRWVSCTDDLRLRVHFDRRTAYVFRVDLLEVLSVGLEPWPSYGIAHLHLENGLPGAQQMLEAVSALWRRYRNEGAVEPSPEIGRADVWSPLSGAQPPQALADVFFGSAHSTVWHRAYFIASAEVPADVDDEVAFCRAISRGIDSIAAGRRAIARDPERQARQSEELGPFRGYVVARNAAFTHRGPSDGAHIYNVRSYWSEALLFGLIQQERLEAFVLRLGEFGLNPKEPRLDDLYDDWLSFRNLLWWTQLSITRDVPQRLVKLQHLALGTRSLFSELQGNFDTYIEQRRRDNEDAFNNALSTLQVYGAAFAVVSMLAAWVSVVQQEPFSSAGAIIGVSAVLLVVAASVVLFSRSRLSRSSPAASHASPPGPL